MAGRSKLVRENFQVPPSAEPPAKGKLRPSVRARKAAASMAEKTPKASKARKEAIRAGKSAESTLTTGQRRAAASAKASLGERRPPRPLKDRGFEEKGKRGQPKSSVRVSTTRAKTRGGTAIFKPRVQNHGPTLPGAY